MAGVWARPDRGARGPAPEHSRQDIAAAAIELADSGGLAAATMRAIAGLLGTSAGSLYRYVASRDELVDVMIDAALAELDLSAKPSGDCLADLLDVAQAQLDLFRRHPWLIDAMPRMSAAGPNTLGYFDHCLKILSTSDTGTSAKMEAVAMMTGVVTLFARPTAAVSFDALDPHRHPNLIAAFAAPGPPPPPDLFRRTVTSVLTGLLGIADQAA